MKSAARWQRERIRERLKDGQRTDKPLPLGKLRTDAPAKRAPADKWFNRRQVQRGTPKPWKQPNPATMKTHQQKRLERAVARWLDGMVVNAV